MLVSMLKNIKISNFYSFNNEAEVSFIENDKSKPLSLIFGHNNSGKTNLLKAIYFTKWLILDSFTFQKVDEEFPFFPYRFVNSKNGKKKTILEVVFTQNERTFKYRVELDVNKIFLEQLWVQNVNERTTFSTLFKRKLNEKSDKYSYVFNDFSMTENVIEKIIRKNCTLLSVAKQIEHEASKEIIDFWESVWTNVTNFGKIRNSESEDLLFVSEIYNKHPRIFDQVKKYFCDFDLGTSDLYIETKDKEVNGKKRTYYRPMVSHKRSDSEDVFDLPLFFESSGTKSLYVILMYLTVTLVSGGVTVLDEIDSDLHPLLVSKILEIFLNKTINRNGAQLILTTHNPDLMNILDKDKVILVEKDYNLETDAYLLSNISGVRNTDNFAAKYRAGAYGAIMKE